MKKLIVIIAILFFYNCWVWHKAVFFPDAPKENSSLWVLALTNSKPFVATPEFSPEPGIYNNEIDISIYTKTTDAKIYYTSDGTEPIFLNESLIPQPPAMEYTSPILVSDYGNTLTIKAIAIQEGLPKSEIATGTWVLQTATPNFAPGEGTYNSDQIVSISTSTLGATIHYTTDGTNPTISSPVYTSPISVAGHGTSATIKAMAVKTGMVNSSIASGTWNINYDAVATPTFSPSAGTYNSDQTISISTSTSGAIIYYTLDGTNPTTSSPIYTTPISVVGHGTSITIKAMAVKTGMVNSNIASGTWNINYDAVATPTFSPSAGTYNSDQTISISTSTSGAIIYYTLDGTNPTTSSPIYTTPISVVGHFTSITIKAIAVKSGMLDSSIASGTWNIIYPHVATPIFTPSPGHYSSPQNISITTTTAGATIHYTLDGTNPTTSSPIYTTPLPIWSIAGRVIKAIGVKTGLENSFMISGTFSYPPLKTGQTQCWNSSGSSISCAGTGHDGNLQMGIARSYTDNGDGTITDNATGLVWQKCSRGQNNDSTCSGTAIGSNWTVAGNYCNALSLAGRTWRLPTIQELQTLVNYGSNSVPAINTTFFPSTASNYYRTSTSYAFDSTIAWQILFASYYSGGIYANQPKTNSYAVRCVSGLKREYVGNFTDNGDGTIRHNVTGLIWQKCSRGQSNDSTCSGTATTASWTTALSYCNTLSLAGRSWRLPSVSELYTLVDVTKTSAPTIDTTYFPSTPGVYYWTSTSYAMTSESPGTDVAWVIKFSEGFVYNHFKTDSYNVRCVSGP